MIVALSQAIGFSVIAIICGFLSLKRAKSGALNPMKPLIIGLIVYLVAVVGVFAGGGFDGQDILNFACALIISGLFFVLASNA